MTDAEARIVELFALYEPASATFGAAVRAKLRARLPGLVEIVYHYENQGALVFSYSPTEHGYQGVCAVGVYADRVQLSFPAGGKLAAADPQKLLQGRGGAVRHVVLGAPADLDRPEIEALLAAALELAGVRPVPGTTGAVILKVDEQKKRAKRAAKG